MGCIKSSLFFPKQNFLIDLNNKLSELSKVLVLINSRLDQLESTTYQYLTSIHQKDKLLEEIKTFLDEKTDFILETPNLSTLNSLKKLQELNENGEIEIINHSKAIKKEEKHEILKERIRKRKHSARLEMARISVKEEKIFGNLEHLVTKKEEIDSVIKLSENL